MNEEESQYITMHRSRSSRVSSETLHHPHLFLMTRHTMIQHYYWNHFGGNFVLHSKKQQIRQIQRKLLSNELSVSLFCVKFQSYGGASGEGAYEIMAELKRNTEVDLHFSFTPYTIVQHY